MNRFGNATDIFKAPVKELRHIEGMSEVKAKAFKDEIVLQRAEEELTFLQKHNIRILALGTDEYPERLKNCTDAPLLLFYKGNANLNATKVVAIVGTRKNTEYGVKLTEELIEGLQ